MNLPSWASKPNLFWMYLKRSDGRIDSIAVHHLRSEQNGEIKKRLPAAFEYCYHLFSEKKDETSRDLSLKYHVEYMRITKKEIRLDWLFKNLDRAAWIAGMLGDPHTAEHLSWVRKVSLEKVDAYRFALGQAGLEILTQFSPGRTVREVTQAFGHCTFLRHFRREARGGLHISLAFKSDRIYPNVALISKISGRINSGKGLIVPWPEAITGYMRFPPDNRPPPNNAITQGESVGSESIPTH